MATPHARVPVNPPNLTRLGAPDIRLLPLTCSLWLLSTALSYLPPPQAQPEAMELVSRARQAHVLRRGRRTFAPHMSLAEDGEEAEEEDEEDEEDGGPPKVAKMDRARREVENDRDYRDLRKVLTLSSRHCGNFESDSRGCTASRAHQQTRNLWQPWGCARE